MQFCKFFDYQLAGFVTIKTREFGAGRLSHAGKLIDNGDLLEVMTHAHFVVIRIVGRGHFDCAGAEFRLDKIVGHYRNLAIHQRQHQHLPDQLAISFVFGVYRHGRVAQHRLRPRRRHSNRAVAVFEWITKIIKLALLRLAQNFEIGQYGLIVRTPIHNAIAAINHSVVVQAHKGFADSARKILVHGETFARPIDRRALAPDLLENLPAVLLLPGPDAFGKLLTAKIVARQAFLLQLARHHQLRRDTGVIHSRQPQRAKSGHAFISGQHIHHGVLQSVAHMKRAGNVRRRDHNRENGRVRILINLGSEIAALFPTRIVIPLGCFRIVSFWDLDHFQLKTSDDQRRATPPGSNEHGCCRRPIVNHARQLFISTGLVSNI